MLIILPDELQLWYLTFLDKCAKKFLNSNSTLGRGPRRCGMPARANNPNKKYPKQPKSNVTANAPAAVPQDRFEPLPIEEARRVDPTMLTQQEVEEAGHSLAVRQFSRRGCGFLMNELDATPLSFRQKCPKDFFDTCADWALRLKRQLSRTETLELWKRYQAQISQRPVQAPEQPTKPDLRIVANSEKFAQHRCNFGTECYNLVKPEDQNYLVNRQSEVCAFCNEHKALLASKRPDLVFMARQGAAAAIEKKAQERRDNALADEILANF